MRADLTSAEIAMSGSYFDDVLRDPRRYGIENTTDKVRRPGAVRRRRDAVCTERIVGHSYIGPTAFWEITPARGTFPRSASAYSFGGGRGSRWSADSPNAPNLVVGGSIAQQSAVPAIAGTRGLCAAGAVMPRRCEASYRGRWPCAGTARTVVDLQLASVLRP